MRGTEPLLAVREAHRPALIKQSPDPFTYRDRWSTALPHVRLLVAELVVCTDLGVGLHRLLHMGEDLSRLDRQASVRERRLRRVGRGLWQLQYCAASAVKRNWQVCAGSWGGFRCSRLGGGWARLGVASWEVGSPSKVMEQDDDRRLLLTVREAAALLAIGRTTLYELIGAGELGTVHIGRAVRIPRAELEAFVDRRCQTSTLR